jgi:plastocyanin
MRALLAAAVALLVLAAPASAEERLLTLYSPPIDSEPYVHKSTWVTLDADGMRAPKEPGAVLGFVEQVLVDSKRPDAKPLPVDKMMVHHLLYYTPERVDASLGCLGDAFLAGRGEEHPDGRFDMLAGPEQRARYGIRNAKADGSAPAWLLNAMVMNHYQRSKRFYVRTKLWYTTEPREPLYPATVGDCRHFRNGMSYDVPGGGGTYVDRSQWTVPFNARILAGISHHHGGAKHHTLASKTCGRGLLDAKAYYGAADHPYNTLRPILHEPGPVANGSFTSVAGLPVAAGEVLERAAYHDNANPHVAAMGFWVLQLARDDSLTRCGPLPGDLREVTRPARYDRRAPYVYDRRVPQLFTPTGRWRSVGRVLPVGDQYFRSGRVTAQVGERITWRFAGVEPHSVTVANGPRGFSSNYLGQVDGEYSFTPTVPGTYRLTCLIHPTTMGQTLKVRR